VNKSPSSPKIFEKQGIWHGSSHGFPWVKAPLKIFKKNFIFFEPNGNELRLNSQRMEISLSV